MMAPIPIFGEHLLHTVIGHATNTSKELLNLKDTASDWGGWVWHRLARAYSDWNTPEPQPFDRAGLYEGNEWTGSTESLRTIDSWFEGDSWTTDDTFSETESPVLGEFEDGVAHDPSYSVTPQAEWWESPKVTNPENPMPLGYEKSSFVRMTEPREVPIDITRARDRVIAQNMPRPHPSTYTTHDFGVWPWGTIIPLAEEHEFPKEVVQEYNDPKNWFLRLGHERRWGMKSIHEVR